MYDRRLNLLSLHNIIVDNQLGFRVAHSTRMAIMRMVNDISNERDNIDIYSLGVFIDLSKAFNAINHEILLQTCPMMIYNWGKDKEWFNDTLASVLNAHY